MGRAFEFRKARKMKRWANIAKIFTKISREIAMAIKDGGTDPNNNSRLRAIIQNAKAANMPKDNIERAIKKASDKDATNFKELIFEGYGPYGVAFIVETATDNKNRTVANVRAAFKKYNGNLSTSGSVIFMFEHISVFKICSKEIEINNIEQLELGLINYELKEIFKDENNIVIYAPFEQFGAIQKYLEDNHLNIISSNFERIPTTTTKLSKKQQLDIEELLECLYNCEDVQNVYHSME